MSLVHLFLEGNSGRTAFDKPIKRGSILKLTKYVLTFHNQSDSNSAGPLLNIQIFDHALIDSLVFCNLNYSKNAIPLANDVSKQVTIETFDCAMDINNDLRQAFDYRVTKMDGSLANVRSVQLFFELFHHTST